MNHCLHVDEIIPNEYVSGENENAGSCKEAEGCEEYDRRITNLIFLSESRNGKDVERWWTELEGKKMPVVIPAEVACGIHLNAEEKLLSNLKKHHYNPNDGGDDSDGFVLCVFEGGNQNDRSEYNQRDAG